MSWFSETLKRLKSLTVPDRVVCKTIECNYIKVVGDAGAIELNVTKDLIRLALTQPDKKQNRITLALKSDGEASINIIAADGTIKRQMAINSQGEILS